MDLEYMEYLSYIKEYFPQECENGFLLNKKSFTTGLKAINSNKFKEYTSGLSPLNSSRLFLLIEFVCWKLEESSPIKSDDYTYLWKEFRLTIDLNTVVRRVMSGDTPLPLHYYSRIPTDSRLTYKHRNLEEKISLANIARSVFEKHCEFVPFCFKCGGVDDLKASPNHMNIKCSKCNES